MKLIAKSYRNDCAKMSGERKKRREFDLLKTENLKTICAHVIKSGKVQQESNQREENEGFNQKTRPQMTVIIRSGQKQPKKKRRPQTVLKRLLVGLILLGLQCDPFQRLAPALISNQVEGLQITQFRVPSFVPANLATTTSNGNGHEHHQLTKPILFDCDYEYRPEEDERLTVKWFKNKEAEPFYQWLPELNVRHFADWIRPLLNQSFVSDPRDPLKRYRSLLIRKLSLNLTGQYTCLVSSLAGQDMRQASLVVYQPPRALTFEHRIFPAPAALLPAAIVPSQSLPVPSSVLSNLQRQQAFGLMSLGANNRLRADHSPTTSTGEHTRPFNGQNASPTQFKGLSGPTAAFNGPSQQHAIVRPPNNLQVQQNFSAQQQHQFVTTSPTPQATTKIVYTHDGRPIRRKTRRQVAPFNLSGGGGPMATDVPFDIPSWQLRKRLGNDWQPGAQLIRQNYVVQLHQFQCQASQITPRPVIVLTVKRDAESIAQYLHEASVVNIRPYLMSQRELMSGGGGARNQAFNYSTGTNGDDDDELLVTLYDITVSATVALNVSLPIMLNGGNSEAQITPMINQQQELQLEQAPLGINTILNFRRGQRMSFECHLEITGTEFERRERIYINEQEVYQFAEAEEERRRVKQRQQLATSGGGVNQPIGLNQRNFGELTTSTSDGGFLASLGLGPASNSAQCLLQTTTLAATSCWLVVLLAQALANLRGALA